MLNRFAIHRDQIDAALDPGETARALTSVAYFSGFEDLGDPPSRADRDLLIDHLLGLPSPFWVERTDRLVTGVSLIGHRGCAAMRMRDAVVGGFDDLVPTDRRLLAVRIPAGAPAEIGWQAPRADVVGIHRRPRLLQAGRLMVAFTDGSIIALMAGLVRRAPARRLVDAWGVDGAGTVG